MNSSITVKEKELCIHEECGIIGIISTKEQELAKEIYLGLFSLQHRGQESAGIALLYNNNKVAYYKDMGLVNNIFGEKEISSFPSSKIGIGHVRYSTTGSSNVINAQPVVFYGRFGRQAIAHNGNVINAEQIKTKLLNEGHIFQSSIDSEIVAALINEYSTESFEGGVIKACAELVGSFSLVLMAGNQLIAVRDKYGLKPLIMGSKDGSIIFASESCALDAIDAKVIRDVAPGEVITVNTNGEMHSTFLPAADKKPCVFEYVYLSRSDSVIDGVSVYDSRYECGRQLAKLCKIDADIVAGVPDSAVVSARGYSDESGIPYVDALSKNRYIGRTFIQPNQTMRESSVKIKLNAFRSNIKDKRLILIDDSIVRGTTSRKIIQLLRNNGAKEVHMLVASPIVKYPCFFGVDMQNNNQLIGGYRSVDEICKEIGADSLHYIPLDQLTAACKGDESSFCCACFDGNYPMDVSKYNCGKLDLE